MVVSHVPQNIDRFRWAKWRFQQTFITPLKDLNRFVSAVISVYAPLNKASLVVDAYVFEPKTLNAFLAQRATSKTVGHGLNIEVEGHREIEKLLHSALADWIDFLFIPTPTEFILYADHDEYATFYAKNKENLHRLVQELSKQGFERIDDYKRSF